MGKVLISGDVVVDHHIYKGRRHKASATELLGVRVVRQHGGAMSLTDLISAVITRAAKIREQQGRSREKR
jgi:hypothetical protein